MGIRFSGMVLAVVTTAFLIAPGSSALAQFGLPGAGGGVNTGDRMGGGGGGKGATQKNLNTSRSNVDRMGGGGGGKGATQRATNLNTSRSNVDRMGGGGGGKGATGSSNAVKLNTSRSN